MDLFPVNMKGAFAVDLRIYCLILSKTTGDSTRIANFFIPETTVY